MDSNSVEKLQDRPHRMDKADSVVHVIFTVITFFAIIASVIIIVFTTANVVSRYIFSKNFNGSVEVSEQLMGIIAFGAMPIVSMINGHIKVDLIVEKFSKGGQLVMTVINNVACGAVMIYLGYYTWLKGIRIMEKGMHTTSLKIPLYPLYLFIAVMFVLAAICCFYCIVHIAVDKEPVNQNTLSLAFKRKKTEKKENAK